jgi:hypothetical protein
MVTLRVTDNLGATGQVALRISVNNTPPRATITSPTNGMRYPLTRNHIHLERHLRRN